MKGDSLSVREDGVFVDCRFHWKGKIGGAAVSFSRYEGGVAHIGTDGADR